MSANNSAHQSLTEKLEDLDVALSHVAGVIKALDWLVEDLGLHTTSPESTIYNGLISCAATLVDHSQDCADGVRTAAGFSE